jgi:hypothetical protein
MAKGTRWQSHTATYVPIAGVLARISPGAARQAIGCHDLASRRRHVHPDMFRRFFFFLMIVNFVIPIRYEKQRCM